MGEIRAVIHDGEYEVIFNEGTGELRANRHGVEWRDLTGDNLVLSMLMTIVDQEEKLLKKQFDTPVGKEYDWTDGASDFQDNAPKIKSLREIHNDAINKLDLKIQNLTLDISTLCTGTIERINKLQELTKLEQEKLEVMKHYEYIVERQVENQGVEQSEDPFFRMVNLEDSTLNGILETMSKMSTLSTGLADDDWVIDTDGLIIGDPILKMAKISNTHDKEFYSSATDIVLYLAHEVKRLREGYRFLADISRSRRNLDWDSLSDLQNFAISVKEMACNNLLGVSHDGTKRKFFKYGRELS